MAQQSKASSSESTETVDTNSVERASVPPQRPAEKVVHEITEVGTEKLSLLDRTKKAVKDKKVIAGASSVVLIAVGVFVARKRNVPSPDNTTED